MGFIPFMKAVVMGIKKIPATVEAELKQEAKQEPSLFCQKCEFLAKTPASLKAHNTRKHS